MYALRLFGLRFSVAADDLGVPAAVTLLIRVIWVGLTTAFTALAFDEDLEDCSSNNAMLLKSYILALLGVGVASSIAFACMYVIANRGSLHEPEKRSGMKYVLYALIVMYIVEFLINCFGIFVAASWEKDLDPVLGCDETMSKFYNFIIAAIVFVLLDVVIFSSCWYLFLNRNKPNLNGLRLDEFELKSFQWQARCRRWCDIFRCCTCGLYGYHPKHGSQVDFAYSQVGDVFATFFAGFKLTPTELLAAFFLLKAEQTEKRRVKESQQLRIKVDGEGDDGQPVIAYQKSANNIRVKPKLESFPSSSQISPNNDTLDTLCEIHDVLPYSEGINTWKLFFLKALVEKKLLSETSKLVRNAFRHNRHRKRNAGMHQGDNCCAWNHIAMVSMSNIQMEDLVFSSFSSYANELVAYAVAVDHKKKNVIIGFRGSLAMADFLTDASLQPESLTHVGKHWGFDGSHHYAHSGMLAVALKIRAIVEENGILYKLLGMEHKKDRFHDGIKEQQKLIEGWEREVHSVDDSKLPDCTGYKLVVIGESLGAAISAIMSLLLKPVFPDLKGYGVSTPGCIFDKDLCEKVAPYFTTVFAGKDIVPRANWTSLTKIREETIDCLRRCKVNKNTAFRSIFKKIPPGDMMYPADEVPDSPGVRWIDEMKEKNAELSATASGARGVNHIVTYCPGRIIHLCKVQTIVARDCCGYGLKHRQRSYEPYWVHNREEMAYFTISANGFMDHMPTVVRKALEECIDYCR